MTENFGILAPPGRVSRRVYTDPEVFAAEQDRIFSHVWLFVAHESQIPDPGDFVTAQVGDRSTIVVRHVDGRIHAFDNRCAHRGMRVCNARRGSRKRFVCPYHGWAFSTDGSLIGVPHAAGYDGTLDEKDKGLAPVARVESYRGFVFANCSLKGPALVDYLGPMSRAIDNLVDRAPNGRLKMTVGFRQEYAGNWKLHMENANDLMHASILHTSSVEAAREVGSTLEEEAEDHAMQMFKGNGLPLDLMDRVGIHGFPGGHSYMGGFYTDGPITQSTDSDPVNAAYRAALVAAHGEERAGEIMNWDTFNHLIYPNLILNPKHQQMRLLQPVAVDRTIVHSACFELLGAPPEMYERSVAFLNALNSPASLITSDDIAAFNAMQEALESSDAEWIDLSRGQVSDLQSGNDGLVGKLGTSELPLRVQYDAWRDHMSGP